MLRFRLFVLFVGLVFSMDMRSPVQATTSVQQVNSPGGIQAYLIEETGIPFMVMSFYFRGGSVMDPEGLEGLAYLASSTMDEGAGDLDSVTFREELEDHAIRLSFDASRDNFSGSLQTLTEHRAKAFELLRLSLQEPRFDEEPVERIRQQILISNRQREEDPQVVSGKLWFKTAFKDHVYQRETRGTEDSLSAITKADLQQFVKDRIARDNLVIGVSGDIDAETLGALLDSTFGDLPQSPNEVWQPAIFDMSASGTEIAEMNVPQSAVTFGHVGFTRDDPRYYAAYVANHILGGGGFSSRLMQEVREKRGLAYGTSSSLYPLDAAGLFIGSVSTNNDDVAESIAVISEQIERMRDGDISQENLDDAKRYLTGSFPLRLTSNRGIAGLLAAVQLDDLGADYLDNRNAIIDALTLDEVREAAKALYQPENLLISIAGQPSGL